VSEDGEKRRTSPKTTAPESRGRWRPLLDTLDTAIRDARQENPFQRDARAVARLQPLLRGVCTYYGTEVRGWHNLPRRGPFLVVGNHSGGAQTTDLAFFLAEWVKTRGAAAPLYALAYDLMFSYPVIGPALRQIGVVPASLENARRALAMKAAVVVFPGGDYEVFRPWSQRNRIEFGGHQGFVQLALSTGVPVVPMTIHGAHQSTLVVTRGRWLARWMGIKRLHVNVFPLIWNIPLGLTPAFVPSVQLPSKVTVCIDEPFDWSRHGARAADDPEVRAECYREITGRMQQTLDDMALEHPYPVLARLDELRRGGRGTED
jgi:1-acyl-sn-glycerol-3-phosphate acyltransferase